MATTAFQLLDFDGDPRGRRYAPVDRERAYGHWLAIRSLARTASDLGIAEGTLRAWARDDEWRQRAEQADREAGAVALRSLVSVATNEVAKSLQVVVNLRDDERVAPKVRLDAAIFVLGIWGIAPAKVSEVTIRPEVNKDANRPDISNELLRELTTQQLSLAENAIRNGNWSEFIASLDSRQREIWRATQDQDL